MSPKTTRAIGVNALIVKRWMTLKGVHQRPSSSSLTRLLKPLSGNTRTFALRRWLTNTAANHRKLCDRTKMSSSDFAQLSVVSPIPLRLVRQKRTVVSEKTSRRGNPLRHCFMSGTTRPTSPTTFSRSPTLRCCRRMSNFLSSTVSKVCLSRAIIRRAAMVRWLHCGLMFWQNSFGTPTPMSNAHQRFPARLLRKSGRGN